MPIESSSRAATSQATTFQGTPARPVAPRPSFAILIAVTAIGPLALNIFIPSMPGLQRVFTTDYATVQMALSLYLVGIAVAQLFYGPLSDRHGRRPVLLAGLGLCLIGTGLCLFAWSIEALVAGRVIQAVGACSGLVLARAIVRDLYDRAEAASRFGYLTMAMVVAPMVAPAIGGVVDAQYGWRAPFFVVALVTLLVLGASLIDLHETNRTRRGQIGQVTSLVTGLRTLLGTRAFNVYAWQGALGSAVFFTFLGGAPYVMVELLGRPPQEYGFYFIALSAAYMLGNFLSGRFSIRVGSDRMIRYGAGLSVLGTGLLGIVFLAGALSPPLLFATMSLNSIGNGMSLPNAMAGAVSVDPHVAGTASGLAGFLQMSVGAALSYLVGALLDDSAAPFVAIMFLAAAGAFLVHAMGHPREHRRA